MAAWIFFLAVFFRVTEDQEKEGLLAVYFKNLKFLTCTATALHTPPILRSSDLTPASRV